MIFKKRYLPLLFAMALFGCSQNDPQSSTQDNQAIVDTQTPTNALTNNSSSTDSQTTSTLPADAPSYTVLFDHSYPPFSFRDEYGNIIGYEIDIINAIGEEAGFEVNAVPASWKDIFNKLESEEADLIGGVSITPERQALYDLSEPHIVTDLVFVYKGAPKSYEDIIKGTISVQEDTSYLSLLQDIPELNADQISTYPTSYLAFQHLILDNADATFNNRAILTSEIASISDQVDINGLQITPIPNVDKDITAFAIKKGNKELLDQVNMGLDKIKENGKYDEITQKWFKDNVSGTSTIE